MIDIKEIHYRDMDGNLIWVEKMIFKRLFAIDKPGDPPQIVRENINYFVRRVAVADCIQHLNIERGS